MLHIKSSASRRTFWVIALAVVTVVLCFDSAARAQKMLSSSAWKTVTQFTGIPKNTKVHVRVTEPIDMQSCEGGQFAGVVDKTVYDGYGNPMIPKGSNVVLMVRNLGNDRLVLDLVSIEADGEQFGSAASSETISMANVQAAGVPGGGRILTSGDHILVPENAFVVFRLSEPFQVAAS